MRLVDFKLQSEKHQLVYYMIDDCSKDKNTLGNIILPNFLLISCILPDMYTGFQHRSKLTDCPP